MTCSTPHARAPPSGWSSACPSPRGGYRRQTSDARRQPDEGQHRTSDLGFLLASDARRSCWRLASDVWRLHWGAPLHVLIVIDHIYPDEIGGSYLYAYEV